MNPATNANPDAECNGTVGSSDAFALSIWMSKDGVTEPIDAFKACGSAGKGALGFTLAQARGYANMDFSGDSTVNYTPFQWATSTTGVNTITGGWQDSNATSNYPIMNCGSVEGTIGGTATSAWKCFDISNNFSFSVGGGCTNAQGTPVHIKDAEWSTVQWPNNGAGCTQGNLNFVVGATTYSLQSNSCPVTYTPTGGNSTSLTCGGTWGTFKSDGTAWNWGPGGDGNFQPASIVNQGDPCSSINANGTDNEKLNRLQCFANYYWRTNYASNKCMREIRANWGATTPGDFLIKDGPGRPRALAVMEKMTYLSKEVATFTQYEDDYRGIQVKDSRGQASWVSCQTKAKNTINVTQISASQMLIKFVSETSLADTKTACEAAALTEEGQGQLNLGEMRMLFKMTKQP